MFNGIFSNKRILVTGHTGFKGSWLTFWLDQLGAEVFGVSAGIPTKPSLIDLIGSQILPSDRSFMGRVENDEWLKEVVKSVQPDFIFHLAAQSLVKQSFADPLDTFKTNVIGSASTLLAARCLDKEVTVVMVTSDKCYKNNEWVWGYRETDSLGGDDPYSASKACAEIMISSFMKSRPFFDSYSGNNLRIVTARAGNVIGGGDWADGRIVVDTIKSWARSEKVFLRSPASTRPWQHVLEPLSGYLSLAQMTSMDPLLDGESFNFGPSTLTNHTVLDVVQCLSNTWGLAADEAYQISKSDADYKEAGLLSLSCEKAKSLLGWHSVLTFEETINFTGTWYKNYYNKVSLAPELCKQDLNNFCTLADERGLPWCR